MFNMPGTTELLIIAGIATLIFGPSQIPKMGRAMGDTIREFRRAGRELVSGEEKDKDDADDAR